MDLNKVSTPRQTLGAKCYFQLRDAIVSLALKPGQMIYENDLAASLGVSRTPIREALLMLNKEELLEILPQRGARVAYISEQKVREARFVRQSLEVSAFVSVAQKWDRNNLDFHSVRIEATKLIEEQRSALSAGDTVRFLNADEAFHELILKQHGNQTLIEVVARMRVHLNRMRYLEVTETSGNQEIIKQHEELLAAVEMNDETSTKELLIRHLHRLDDHLPSIIAKNSDYFYLIS